MKIGGDNYPDTGGDRWLDTAAPQLLGLYGSDLNWLKVGSYVARGDRKRAETMLKSLMKGANTAGQYYQASYAAFLLGDLETAALHYERAQKLDDKTIMHTMHFRKLDASIGAAFAYQQLGQIEKANTLLERIDAELEAQLKTGLRLDPETWYRKAELTAISGNRQRALFFLQRAVDEGWRQHWRPFVDPSFSSVINDANFQSMMAGLATRMDVMRKELASEESFSDGWQG